ncbi:hypothetical protein CI102_10433 [Trichoderma harzianum]|nr:hypothetical protein CI102_10433 [Trichoderma harzianum]
MQFMCFRCEHLIYFYFQTPCYFYLQEYIICAIIHIILLPRELPSCSILSMYHTKQDSTMYRINLK